MNASTAYDVLIVGAGVAGTALLYQLARFTDLQRLCLVEKYPEVAQANSHPRNNSQTLHHGDIETNYSLDKARSVKRMADMLIRYASALPARERDRILTAMPRMVLGVGEAECAHVRQHHAALSAVHPRLQLLGPQAIADLEPNVALIEGTWRREPILAAGVPDGYSAVDFQALAESFSDACVRIDRRHSQRQVTQLFSTQVDSIRREGAGYVLATSRGLLQARAVVVCAGTHTLGMAQRLGLGLDFACLPIAGSFYFVPDALNGKVYTLQNPRLPFAAVHGDRDLRERGQTRFGPTALPMSQLERNRPETRRPLPLDRHVAGALWDLVRSPDTRGYVLRNALYAVPGLNRRLFAKAVRKIVPSIEVADLLRAERFGGVRPQLIDRKTGRLRHDEAKLGNGQGLIFNITPSPGATACLGNAEADMRTLAAWLGARIDETAFARELGEAVPAPQAPGDGRPVLGTLGVLAAREEAAA